MFDAESISIETIYQRVSESDAVFKPRVSLSMTGHFVESGNDLLVGSARLIDLYHFLKAYREETNDLDQLYEKNVRKFLGSRGRINKAIALTLNESPDRFGLYNNGITIVVSDYSGANLSASITLADPFIVNGCQTTRSIWEVFQLVDDPCRRITLKIVELVPDDTVPVAGQVVRQRVLIDLVEKVFEQVIEDVEVDPLR